MNARVLDGVLEKKVAFDPNRTPPTLDDIYDFTGRGRVMASANVKKLFKSVVTPAFDFHKHIEQFNFGTLTRQAIADAQKEAIEFIAAGLFSVPYPINFYRCTVDFEDGMGPIGMSILLVDGCTEEHGHHNASVLFTSDGRWLTAMHSINCMNTRLGPLGAEVEVQVPRKEFDFWEEHVSTGDGDKPTISDIADGSLIAMGLTMILNTKGVRKDRREPPEKPNRARARVGKPLLPWVTRVYTDVYNRAIAPGEGSHSSPRPHRRRAHVRRIPARHGHEAYSVPIPAMLVNWDGKPLERGQYEVKHHG